MCVGRLIADRWNLVHVHIKEVGSDADEVTLFEAGLLGELATCRGDGIDIGGLDVTAGLKPASQLEVVDQRDGLSERIEHKGAGREVTRLEVVTGEGIAP